MQNPYRLRAVTQNTDLLAFGRRILAEQPFSILLGAELTAFEPGRAELRLPVRHELKQQYGFVHGGVLSYLADNALTYAGGSALSGQGHRHLGVQDQLPAASHRRDTWSRAPRSSMPANRRPSAGATSLP
jgi:hypothetical protein